NCGLTGGGRGLLALVTQRILARDPRPLEAENSGFRRDLAEIPSGAVLASAQHFADRRNSADAGAGYFGKIHWDRLAKEISHQGSRPGAGRPVFVPSLEFNGNFPIAGC